jgi:hypothetical protein
MSRYSCRHAADPAKHTPASFIAFDLIALGQDRQLEHPEDPSRKVSDRPVVAAPTY